MQKQENKETSADSSPLPAEVHTPTLSNPFGSRKAFMTFPEKIHCLLSSPAFSEWMWWDTDELFCFVPHEAFVTNVLNPHFQGTLLESFTRKLNRWGYKRVHHHHPSTSADRKYRQQDILTYERDDFVRHDPARAATIRLSKKKSKAASLKVAVAKRAGDCNRAKHKVEDKALKSSKPMPTQGNAASQRNDILRSTLSFGRSSLHSFTGANRHGVMAPTSLHTMQTNNYLGMAQLQQQNASLTPLFLPPSFESARNESISALILRNQQLQQQRQQLESEVLGSLLARQRQRQLLLLRQLGGNQY